MSRKPAPQAPSSQLAKIPNPSISFDMHTVLSALENVDITARFILVMECEQNEHIQVQLPKWCIGGEKATLEPNRCSLSDLRPISKSDHAAIDVKRGWSKLHHFIYVVDDHTDINGWEYRSNWSNGVPAEDEEPWTGNRTNQALVRRRLWLASCVKDDELISAKKVLAAYMLENMTRKDERMIRGDILRKEVGMWRSLKWVTRHMVLYEDRVEIFQDSRAAHEHHVEMNNAKAKNEKCPIHDPTKVAVMMLRNVSFGNIYGEQIGPASDKQRTDSNLSLKFILRDRRSDSVFCTLDCEDEVDYIRWTRTLQLLLAINSFDVDFQPCEYGPPNDDLCPNHVIGYGHLSKQGHFRKNWRTRFFHLTPFELLYFKGDIIKGKVVLQGSELLPYEGDEDQEKTLEFTLRAHSGHQLTMRVELDRDLPPDAALERAIEKRKIWERYIQIEINRLEAMQQKYNLTRGYSKDAEPAAVVGGDKEGESEDDGSDSDENEVEGAHPQLVVVDERDLTSKEAAVVSHVQGIHEEDFAHESIANY